MKAKLTKWLRKLLKMEVPVQVVGSEVPQAEVDAPPMVEEYTPHWVKLPEGKKVDIRGNLAHSYIIDHFLNYEKSDEYLSVDLDSWTSPMHELFKLWRKDNTNIEINHEDYGFCSFSGLVDHSIIITHKILGISFRFHTSSNFAYSVYENNTGLSKSEIRKLVVACELFRSTKEYQRYLRIKSLSDVRAEKLAKELDEQEKIKYRNAQTNRIRDYLENK